MQAFKRCEFDVDTDNWNEITKIIKQGIVRTISKFGNNAKRSGAKFYVCINTDISYYSEGQYIQTRVKDLHTTVSETLIEVKDINKYVEEYIDMLQEFCIETNKGGIGSAGEFNGFEGLEIIISKPAGLL